MLKGSDFEVAPIQMHKNTTVKFGRGSGYVTEYSLSATSPWYGLTPVDINGALPWECWNEQQAYF